MNRKIAVFALVISSSLVANGAQAGQGWKKRAPEVIWDTAKVTHVEPIIREVRISNPQRECWQEEVRRPVTVRHGPSRGTSTLVGAIVGGVIGNQFGGGSGKKLATAAGTMLGASIGNDAARASEHYHSYDQVSEETRCTTNVDYHTEERITGYWVTYRYHGEEYTTRMPHDPGDSIQLKVKIRPYWN